jgi:hypothetical protein
VVASFAACCSSFRTLTRAAAKAASAKLRQMGVARVEPEWSRRAAVCEQCPLRVVRRGVSYCGRPFLERVDRDETVDGCGCPTVAKARTPGEHCPLNTRNRAALTDRSTCDCKWCVAVRHDRTDLRSPR